MTVQVWLTRAWIWTWSRIPNVINKTQREMLLKKRKMTIIRAQARSFRLLLSINHLKSVCQNQWILVKFSKLMMTMISLTTLRWTNWEIKAYLKKGYSIDNQIELIEEASRSQLKKRTIGYRLKIALQMIKLNLQM